MGWFSSSSAWDIIPEITDWARADDTTDGDDDEGACDEAFDSDGAADDIGGIFDSWSGGRW